MEDQQTLGSELTWGQQTLLRPQGVKDTILVVKGEGGGLSSRHRDSVTVRTKNMVMGPQGGHTLCGCLTSQKTLTYGQQIH